MYQQTVPWIDEMGRTLADRLSDQFLLAYAIGDASKRTGFLSETKLQKLAYLSEREMFRSCRKGFNYYFIKLYYGPYSETLRNDLKHFSQIEIIKTESANTGTRITPTEKCLRIFEDFGSLALRNRTFLRTITEVNRQYADFDMKRLLNSVYRMRSSLGEYGGTRRAKTINQLPMRTPILKPIPEEKASQIFTITPSETATLEIYFEKDLFDSISKALESAQKQPLLGFDEVF